MSREKQINEMARVVANGRFIEPDRNQMLLFAGEAEALYNAGYRKQSEVVREIFDDIRFEMHQLFYSRDEIGEIAIKGVLAKLEKEYANGERRKEDAEIY